MRLDTARGQISGMRISHLASSLACLSANLSLLGSTMFSETDCPVPPGCGKRLLPAVLDEIADSDPDRVFVSVPQNLDTSPKFNDISYGVFAAAVDKFAYWLRAQLDSSNGPKVVLYLGPTDIRYLLAILGCAKAGHIAFFSSHRNSVEAHKSIAERAGCDTVLVPDDAPAMLHQVLQVKPLTCIPTPVVEYFFQDLDKVKRIPFHLTWDEAKHKPFCVLHTSGSTGIPKPVFVTYGTFACNDAHQLIPSLGGKPTLVNFLRGKRYLVALPLFHAASLTFTIGYSIFAGVTTVIPPGGPLTASIVNQMFSHGQLDGALLAPSLIVDCYNNSEYCVNMIRNLQFLSYVGGALPEAVGNALTRRIKLMTLMGSCETALHPLEINDDPADWQYLTISKHLGHCFPEHRDGYHELVVRRNPRYEIFQGVFSTFPEKDEFCSGDLFEQHPTKPESWLFRARTDDIIAFTTAEKLNPITMESVISANPKVKSALIGGQGKFQAALLVEPHEYPGSKPEEEQYIKDIWPSILQANRDCPSHGRIMKGFVMITDPTKPIPRAGKGTVQRHAALKLYADEFEKLYVKMQPPKIVGATVSTESANSRASVAVGSPEDLNARIEAAVSRALPRAVEAAMTKILSKLLVGLDGGASISRTNSTISPSRDDLKDSFPTSRQDQASLASQVPTSHTVPPPPKDTIAEASNGNGKSVRRVIYEELSENLDIASLTDEDDLFKHGLDSLQLNSLITVVNAFVIKEKPTVPLLDAKQVYANPTVRQIACMIES